ncbi:MAG: flagellar biosynthesis protein FlaG [Pseudomonas sp. PGPPP4]|uniref:flagellar protein FlaG n=1 Tax=Pseudomonas TaxID=286 RepID=UPI000BD1B89A|nr:MULTISPECIES: flagellar protein FlaG [Pseudomonas]NMZ63080.1 flagellar protein FlaG [Pseudomonas oryzihabitans]OYT81987.1 MAG: flagellar biosynthesis protein FlaG [Pseudomonas sp. PGPPP4]
MSINLTSGLPSSAVGNTQTPATLPVSPKGGDMESNTGKDPKAEQPSRDVLDKAVASIRSDVQNVHRNLEFSVDEASGIPIVKVVATDSGVVIRQIPSEVAVRLAESLKESSNLLFREKA